MKSFCFCFVGQVSNPPTVFDWPLSDCLQVIWGCTFDPTKLMPASVEPKPQSQGFLCHFCLGSLQPTTHLELLNSLKFFEFLACEQQRVLARLQEILSSRDHERSDEHFPFLSGYRSRPEFGGSRILTWFSA